MFFNVLQAIQYDEILLPLALILFLGKLFQVFCKKFGLPQVLGLLVAGILIGLVQYIPHVGDLLLTAGAREGISFISKIGVILIMFNAGLDTDIKQVKATGVAAIVITSFGVLTPLILGFLVATLFNGGFSALSDPNVLYSNLFYGTVLTATSVSVTVATLQELGKLNSKIGTAIVSAAIIDDIIGVILLSFIIGLSGATTGSGSMSYGAKLFAMINGVNGNEPWVTIVLTVLFFVFIFGFGYLMKKGFNWLDKHYPHNRRLPIFGLAASFFYAWLSEMVFGVADITGAFFCGLTLATNHQKGYVERKSEVLGYMIFTPVFFANVGISMQFSQIDASFIGFGICFVLAGIVGKLGGCFLGGLLTKFNVRDSLRAGLGMMVRAEVALICVQKGVNAILPNGNTLINPNITTFVVFLIVLTSCITPILLKMTYKKEMNAEIGNESTSV